MAYTPAHVERFPSWGAFVDRASNRAPVPGLKKRASIDRASDHWWDLNAGFEGALELARDGWPEGETMVQSLSSALFASMSTLIERETSVYDIEGAEIDVARYLEGEPECWQRFEPRVSQGTGRRIIRLVYNFGAIASVSADSQKAKGAAVVACAQLLEFAGHGVQIDAVQANSNGASEVWVRIKNADQPLDVPRVAFALAHPAMMRRFWFSIAEQFPKGAREANGVPNGYGCSCDVPAGDARGDLYMACSTDRPDLWKNPILARAWIVEQLETQGVTIATT